MRASATLRDSSSVPTCSAALGTVGNDATRVKDDDADMKSDPKKLSAWAQAKVAELLARLVRLLDAGVRL